MELYKTIRKEAHEVQIIEKSRFIAHAKPVETREEAEEYIAGIKAQYKDATHNVPAMVIGEGGQIQWASDDGEPQGTSGAPIVQMLVSQGLTNLVVVVTRYFGGIKLGTGGLVRAYTGSARLAVEAAEICSVQNVCSLTYRIEYTHLARIQQLEATIGNIEYGEKVQVELLVPEEDEEKITGMIANITSGSAELTERICRPEKI